MSDFLLAVLQLVKGRKSRCFAGHGACKLSAFELRLDIETSRFGLEGLGFRLQMQPIWLRLRLGIEAAGLRVWAGNGGSTMMQQADGSFWCFQKVRERGLKCRWGRGGGGGQPASCHQSDIECATASKCLYRAQSCHVWHSSSCTISPLHASYHADHPRTSNVLRHVVHAMGKMQTQLKQVGVSCMQRRKRCA